MELLVVGWLVLSFACGFIANQRGRSPVAWGIAALVLSPALVYLVLVAIPTVREGA